MRVVGTFEQARIDSPASTGLVPTMGFLHEGHLSLIEAARQDCDVVIMSLYVNALQFGEAGDLERYPKNLDRDVQLATDAGADIVFAPSDEVVYPDDHQTRVSVEPMSASLEGRWRPGHFEGVATVVAKLLAGLQPDRVYFGRKDAQQLAVVTRLARDLAFPVEVVGCPIVREHDGLALSSRNVFLEPAERLSALALSRGLFRAADLADGGEARPEVLEDAAMSAISDEGGLRPEYARMASAVDVEGIDTLDRPAFLAVAARLGEVRLIDNIYFEPAGTGITVDRGSILDGPSLLYQAEMQDGPRRPQTRGG